MMTAVNNHRVRSFLNLRLYIKCMSSRSRNMDDLGFSAINGKATSRLFVFRFTCQILRAKKNDF